MVETKRRLTNLKKWIQAYENFYDIRGEFDFITEQLERLEKENESLKKKYEEVLKENEKLKETIAKFETN